MPKEDTKELLKKSKRKIHFWLSLAFVFFLLSILLSFLVYKTINHERQKMVFDKKAYSSSKNKNIDKHENEFRRYLDGVYVEAGEDNLYPFAVMIDNHVDARPPSSLSRANLVFEAEAEGGITRYLAVFGAKQDLKEIGPIRSARPYFIDWAKEFSALYVHVGGSPEALVKMSRDNVFHLNQFYHGDYFWRDQNREAPHNVYTSSELIDKYLKKKNKTEGKFFPWYFKDDAPLSKRGEDNLIKINYSLPEYVVEWRYDNIANIYTRFLNGKEHRDKDNNQILAKNVLIAVADAKELDSKLRLKMNTIGKGKAKICLDGICRDGLWEKKNSSARTRFYYENEDNSPDEVEFNAGTTWIEFVRPEIETSVSPR